MGLDLQADRVITCTLTKLAVNPKTGQVTAAMDVRALNVLIGAVLNGAAVEVTTKPIPGYRGDPLPVINEALREVAERAVSQLTRGRTIHGSVDLVDDQGVITTNLGINDGIDAGTRMLVMRGYWDPAQQMTIMRRIGTLQITGSQVRLSQAKSIDGQVPRIGDRVYILYSPPAEVRSIQQGHKTTQSLRYIAGLALIVGIAATATGSQNTSPPGAEAFLFQQAPGVTPVIRINVHRGLNPDPEHTHAFLFYRGNSAGFVADALADGTTPTNGGPLVRIISDGHLQYWEDQPAREVGLSYDNSFQFFDRTGTQTTATLTATYNDAELVPGGFYFYKVRRWVDPLRPQLPLSQQILQPFADITFTVDPADSLGEPSEPTGPVTYSLPATPLRPVGSTTVNPSSATFEWTPATGADQYQVQVYSDAQLGHLVVASPILTAATGQTLMRFTFSDFTFSGDTTFWWVVASRTSEEVKPRCLVGGRTINFIISSKSSFTTVTSPPDPAAASVKSAQPSGVRGFWNERRLRRPGS